MSEMLADAKLSLEEAERLEDEGTRNEMWDELLLGILQSNIAIAEALTGDDACDCDDEWPDDECICCGEDCPFCSEEDVETSFAPPPNNPAVRGDASTYDPVSGAYISWVRTA